MLFTNSLSHLFPRSLGSHLVSFTSFSSPFRFPWWSPWACSLKCTSHPRGHAEKAKFFPFTLLQTVSPASLSYRHSFIQIRRPRVISLSESRETIRHRCWRVFFSQPDACLRQSQAGSPTLSSFLPGLRTLLHIPVKQIRVMGCFQSLPCPPVYSPWKGATGAYLPHLSVPTPQPKNPLFPSSVRKKEWKEYAPAYRVYVRRPPAPNGVCGNGRRRIICHLIGCSSAEAGYRTSLPFSVQIAVSGGQPCRDNKHQRNPKNFYQGM